MLLRQFLYRTEPRLLPVIAGWWIILPEKTNYEEIIRLLCKKMPDPVMLKKVLSGPYGKEMAAGLRRLAENDGRETADSFEGIYGSMRIAGIEKILREKYWKSPVSVTEALYYRGLIYRQNLFISDEVKECYIIPADLLKTIRSLVRSDGLSVETDSKLFIVRPAVPSETAVVQPVDETIPEVISLAAAMKRSGKTFVLPGVDITEEYAGFIEMVLEESGMFPAGGEADSDTVRNFLIRNKTFTRLQIINTWRKSSVYDELHEDMDDLKIEEAPVFDRISPRNTILKLLTLLEPGTWWSLNGFTTAVKNVDSAFLRKHFSNERWIMYDNAGNDLSGLGSWFQLEGSYIQFMIFGPLQWLGIIQTAYADKDKTCPAAFRITDEGLFYLLESGREELSEEIAEKPNLETAIPRIYADGTVLCSRGTSRYFLYMAARFLEIEKFNDSVCSFRLTPRSLAEAERNGLSPDLLLSMFRRFSKNAVPPSLDRMLSNPKGHTLPATIYNAVILTIPEPKVVDEIVNNKRLSKWIIQQINQNSLEIDPKGIADFRRFLMEKEVYVDIRL